jgi:hypothetical protein
MKEYITVLPTENPVNEVVQSSNQWTTQIELWSFFSWPAGCVNGFTFPTCQIDLPCMVFTDPLKSWTISND